MSASLVLIILKLAAVCYVITTSSTLTLTDFRFASSCDTATYTVAEKYCTDRNLSLFLIVDLSNAGAQNVYKRAVDEHGSFWINRSSVDKCSIGEGIDAGQPDFKTISCSMKRHYVCKIKSENAEKIPYTDAYIPCRESTTKEKRQTNVSDPNMTTTVPQNNSVDSSLMSTGDIAVIAVCTTVLLILIVIAIIGFYLLKRHRKPRKYPVREMSALYHRENPCIDKTREVPEGDTITNTGATIGVGVENTNGQVDCDILLKPRKDDATIDERMSPETEERGRSH